LARDSIVTIIIFFIVFVRVIVFESFELFRVELVVSRALVSSLLVILIVLLELVVSAGRTTISRYIGAIR
jgi:hypothetical protein